MIFVSVSGGLSASPSPYGARVDYESMKAEYINRHLNSFLFFLAFVSNQLIQLESAVLLANNVIGYVLVSMRSS